MLRNYNGNVNRKLLRDFRRLCEVNADNFKNMLEAFAQKGEVSFYTNTFMGMVDEMSDAHTLRSEEEIREYLKQDAQQRFDGYLHNKISSDDYLLTAVLEFIKENGNCKYPSKDEMRQLECTAEAKRIAKLPTHTTTAETPKTDEDVMCEIMELAEEVFESRRLTKPEDIFCPIEPYYDRLYVESGDFSGLIEWDSHYGSGDCSDYHVRGQLRNDRTIDNISFYRYHNGTANASAEDWNDKSDLTKEHLITVHKAFVELAEQEGIEFISEIDYDKLST